jgi:hypothetical protein
MILHFVAGGVFAADRTHEIGVQAYVYAYPMIVMEVTRRVSTNVEAPAGSFAPMNQFAHLRAFPDHKFREVVRPNADTLYSIVWFDVAKEPLVVSVSDTGGRYYMLQMMDMWTDVFATPGSRTSGTKAANFAIVGRDWKGTLPNGFVPGFPRWIDRDGMIRGDMVKSCGWSHDQAASFLMPSTN